MKTVLVLFVVILLSGCTTATVVPENNRFVGMVETFEAIKRNFIPIVNGEDKPTIDVVLVHGMCTTNTDWIAQTSMNLLRIFGQEIKIDSDSIAKGKVGIYDNQTELYKHLYPVDGGQIRVYSILWSPVTTPAKKTLCYDQKNRSKMCQQEKPELKGYPYQRAFINTHLKDELMNDCLVDVVSYAGDSRVILQKQFQEALIRIMGSDNTKTNQDSLRQANLLNDPVRLEESNLLKYAETSKTPIFFITESLGSKITYDSLALLRCADKGKYQKAIDNTVSRQVEVFMAANQLPILSIAVDYDKKNTCNQDVQNLSAEKKPIHQDSLDVLYMLNKVERGVRLEQLFNSDNEGTQNPKEPSLLIAFSDPNDVLSYPLKPSEIDLNLHYQTTDVIVSNATNWLLFENPWTAHIAYLKNIQVRKFIGCGNPSSPVVTECMDKVK